jgi:paraquat-inducible protein B
MDGNYSPPKSNLIQDSEGNEENRHPVLNSNKTKINNTKEPNDPHKNILKEEILQIITENFMEMLLDMVNQNVQEALKKFQDTKNKDYEKTQTQINELIGTLNKHQSETENTIKKEINELNKKIDNIKEKVTHGMKTLRKRMKQNHKTQWKDTSED